MLRTSFVMSFILLWMSASVGEAFDFIPMTKENEIVHQGRATKQVVFDNFDDLEMDIDDDDEEVEILEARAFEEDDIVSRENQDNGGKPPAPPKRPNTESKMKGRVDNIIPESKGKGFNKRTRRALNLKKKKENKDVKRKRQKRGKRQQDAWPESLGVNVDLMKDYPKGTMRTGQATNTNTCNSVRAIPADLRALPFHEGGIAPQYVKYTEVYGILLIGSDDVSVEGLKRACYTLRFLLASRFDIRNAVFKMFGYFALIGDNEQQTDLFEYSTWNSTYWDKRARGLGPTFSIPLTSAGDDNQKCKSGDRYWDQDIFVHEAAHAVHKIAATLVIEGFEMRLEQIFQMQVINNGKWAGTYAATNPNEYLAVATQMYLGAFISPSKYISNFDVYDRATLRTYDPEITALLDELHPCVKNNYNVFINRCEWRLNPVAGSCGLQDYELKYNTNFNARSDCATLADKTTSAEGCAITACYYGAKVFNWKDDHCIVVDCPGTSISAMNIAQFSGPAYNIYTALPSMQQLEMTLEREEAQELDMDCVVGPHGSQYCNNVAVKKTCGQAGITTKRQCKKMGCCWNNGDCFYSDPECLDNSVYCHEWAKKGECSRNPGYMYRKCQVACDICPWTAQLDIDELKAMCQDKDEYCPDWADTGECEANPNWMNKNCKLSCGVCSNVYDPLAK